MLSNNPAQFDEPLTACPICNSSEIARHDHDYLGRVIFRCCTCRLQFLNPQYTDAHLADYYSRYIPLGPREKSTQTTRRTISKTDDIRLVGKYVEPGRFLSVGCGDGLELELARQQGWEVEGYDVDTKTTEIIAGRTGATIYSGSFFDLHLPRESYDCVFMDHVLEHPKNPQDYLREIHRILKPDGMLFIGCPNIMSVSCVWKTVLGKLGLRRRRGRHYDTEKHLFYYSPSILGGILEHYYGFEVLVAQGDPRSGLKRSVESASCFSKTLTYLRQTFPLLEGSFRILAKKVGHPTHRTCAPRAAA